MNAAELTCENRRLVCEAAGSSCCDAGAGRSAALAPLHPYNSYPTPKTARNPPRRTTMPHAQCATAYSSRRATWLARQGSANRHRLVLHGVGVCGRPVLIQRAAAARCCASHRCAYLALEASRAAPGPARGLMLISLVMLAGA